MLTEEEQKVYEQWKKKVIPGAVDECWPWPEAVTDDGKPIVQLNNRRFFLSRILFQKENPDFELDKGIFINQTCKDPGCTNPAHQRIKFNHRYPRRERERRD